MPQQDRATVSSPVSASVSPEASQAAPHRGRSLWVVGAGTQAVNGKYHESHLPVNGMSSFLQVESDSPGTEKHAIWYGFAPNLSGNMLGMWRISRAFDVGNNNSGYAYFAQRCDRLPPTDPRDHVQAGGWECDVLGNSPPPSLTWHAAARDIARELAHRLAPHPEPEPQPQPGAEADSTSDDDYVAAYDDGQPPTVSSD